MKTPHISNIAALEQANSAVAYIITIIGRVLVKFPSNTLAPSLVAFTHRYGTSAIRLSGSGDEVVLTSRPAWSGITGLRFPVRLLDAQESEITKWARDKYWAEIRAEKLRVQRTAEARATRARKTIAKAELELATARNELATATAGQAKEPSEREVRVS